ncbi:MAG: hypothetical protein O7D91_00100 [Planctomycetota bacterium]|nr:hypothetical protein [Planctomycetota bacterium]
MLSQITSGPSAIQVAILVVAALMPVVVALVAASLRRKQALRELRSTKFVQVYEELIATVTTFGIAAFRNESIFEPWVVLQGKCAVARIHSGPQVQQSLEGVEGWSKRVADAAFLVAEKLGTGTDATQEEQALREEVGKLLALLEILADNVTEQLGPTYSESNSRWQDFKVSLAYTFLKAKERLFLEQKQKRGGSPRQ